jgi:hypothetical protein
MNTFLRYAACVCLALAAVPGCSGTDTEADTPAAPAAAPADAVPASQSAQAQIQTLQLTYDRPAVVGVSVRASASGLPAGKSAELVWGTAEGGWVIEDYYHFRGKKFDASRTSLGRFPVDANGHLDARFTIPEDYGGMHEVVALIDGQVVAQKGLEVTQSFEMSPSSGPIGTPIEIKVKGLGFRVMDSTWVVNWDNGLVGFVSAVSSKGSAVARFRAAGPAGAHVVHVLSGFQGQGYLNHEQAPNSYLPRPHFTFRTTSDKPVSTRAFAEGYPEQPVPKTEVHVANATVKLSRTQGPVGTGTRTKLVNNYLAVTSCQMNAEALALSQRFGLELERTLDVLYGTTAFNGQLKIAWPAKVLKGDVAPGFTIDLAHKDLSLIVDAANAAKVPMPIAAAAREAFSAARASGFGGQDFSAMVDALCQAAGIERPRLKS